jgi:GNAT superfamily N-acetyltransferase
VNPPHLLNLEIAYFCSPAMTASPYTIESVTKLSDEQKEGVFLLWNNEYPEQLAFADQNELNVYLQALHGQEHILLRHGKQILGWAFSFEREHSRWFAIILSSSMQRKGYGTQLLDRLKQKETRLYGWVIDNNNYLKSNKEHYLSPIDFYLKNGFTAINDSRLETPKISAVRITWSIPSSPSHEI